MKGTGPVAASAGILFVLAVLSVPCAASPAGDNAARPAPPAVGSASPAAGEAAGIRIGALMLSVNGSMIDMRYRVVALETARKAMHPKSNIYLIDQASGMKMSTPVAAKVGKLRQLPHPSADGRWQSMLFQNPGKTVKRGSKVTLAIDDLRFEDLVIQ
jgi:hypothetical protein